MTPQSDAKRDALSCGPALSNLDAALDCGCSCHPRPAASALHDGGLSCPCQKTPAQRRADLDEALALLSDIGKASKRGMDKLRAAASDMAREIGLDLLRLDVSVPFVVSGSLDGRSFYLRERHDVYDVLMSEDTSFSGDLWLADASTPVVVIRSGVSEDISSDGSIDPLLALSRCAMWVKDAILKENCLHPVSGRFCADCGTRTEK